MRKRSAPIAGAVKDASGAVLPGVTVEASSPALIEKVRTVVTDGTGQYRIVNLPPGHLHRDVHAARVQHGQARRRRGVGRTSRRPSTPSMRVGAVEETITVTGESPIVDMQSAAQTRSVTARTFKELPVGRLVDSDGRARARHPGVATRTSAACSAIRPAPGVGARQPRPATACR